jgi:flagellar basal-body rod protein FlgF
MQGGVSMRGLYMAEGAMLVQQAQLQVISNNLANLRTTGFKRDHGVETSFAEKMIYELRPDPGTGKGGTLRPIGTAAHSVATQETVTSFFQGPLEATGRSLDFALVGNGFFMVEGEEGTLYTRNGRFFLDAERNLVTIEGYPVLGEGGPIRFGEGEIEGRPDGAIFVGGAEAARLQIAVFGPDALIGKAGYSYFTTDSAEDGEADYEILSGFLEGSNVSLIREMTALMTVRRSYEAAQKIMITYDQLLDKAANSLGSSA